MRRPRILLAMLVTALAVAVSGCAVDGTIEITSATQVTVDVTVSHGPDGTFTDPEGEVVPVSRGVCSWAAGSVPASLVVERLGTPDSPRCRLTGTLDTEGIAQTGLLASGNGYLFLTMPINSSQGEPVHLDLRITFPGEIVAAVGAKARGLVAHVQQDIFSERNTETTLPMVHVVARDGSVPVDLMGAGGLAAAVGLGVGAGGYAVAAVIRRRQRGGPEASADPDASAQAPSPADAVGSGDTSPEDPAVWAPRDGEER